MAEEFDFDELLEEVKSGKKLTGKDSVLGPRRSGSHLGREISDCDKVVAK